MRMLEGVRGMIGTQLSMFLGFYGVGIGYKTL